MRKLIVVSALLMGAVFCLLYRLKTNETFYGDHWGDPG
jgi:hypothetical protein